VNGIPLAQAAKELRIHPSTLRRWIVAGCPVCELGEVGRGKGSRVDLEAVKRWRGQKAHDAQRQRTDEEILSLLVRSLVDVIQEDMAHLRFEMAEGQAAGLLSCAYQRFWRNFMLRSGDEYQRPPEIEHLCAIWLRWLDR